MDTELYRALLNELYSSGYSKREFCKKHDIPRGWFLDFLNPKTPFRPVRAKTIGMLKNRFGIDPMICEEYNRLIEKEREELCTQSEF